MEKAANPTLPKEECKQEHFSDLLNEVLSPIRMYFETLEDVDERIAYTGQALYDHADKKIDELIEIITHCLGDVIFNEAALGNSKRITPGTLVSCHLNKPSTREKEVEA